MLVEPGLPCPDSLCRSFIGTQASTVTLNKASPWHAEGATWEPIVAGKRRCANWHALVIRHRDGDCECDGLDVRAREPCGAQRTVAARHEIRKVGERRIAGNTPRRPTRASIARSTKPHAGRTTPERKQRTCRVPREWIHPARPGERVETTARGAHVTWWSVHLPRQPRIRTHGHEVRTGVALVARCGWRHDAHGELAVRSDRKMTRAAMIRHATGLPSGHPAIPTHRVAHV